MNDLLNLFGAISTNIGRKDYESRKVGRDELDFGLTISTCYTVDMGYETAILDKNGAHPVERYTTKKEATVGHDKWVAKAKELKKILKLGYGSLVEDSEVTLERRE